MMMKKLIGERIRNIRKANKITQSELGKMINRNQSSIGKYENGDTEIPISVIIDISNALNVSPVDILGVSFWDSAIDKNDDVKIVVHAHWITHRGYDECSNCHYYVLTDTNYCPYCGAKMDEVKL